MDSWKDHNLWGSFWIAAALETLQRRKKVAITFSNGKFSSGKYTLELQSTI